VVCNAAGDQLAPVLVTDGSGGAVIAWTDNRGSSQDVYVQRLNGVGAPQWTANGVALCSAADVQSDLAIAADFTHGAYVAWQDMRTGNADIYAIHVAAAGVPRALSTGCWCAMPRGSGDAGDRHRRSGRRDRRLGGSPERKLRHLRPADERVGAMAANGVLLCGAAGDQRAPRSCSDGVGGAILVWQDLRGGATSDLYAQRVSPAGAPQWLANGVGVSLAANDQTTPEIQRDPAGEP